METTARLLNEAATAEFLSLSRAYLRKLRMKGGATRNPGPPYVRIGGAIRYRVADLEEWVEERIVRPAAMGE